MNSNSKLPKTMTIFSISATWNGSFRMLKFQPEKNTRETRPKRLLWIATEKLTFVCQTNIRLIKNSFDAHRDQFRADLHTPFHLGGQSSRWAIPLNSASKQHHHHGQRAPVSGVWATRREIKKFNEIRSLQREMNGDVIMFYCVSER